MPHRIDQTKLTEAGISKAAVLAAVTRLTQIETATTATTTQVRTAVQGMAKYLKHIIKVLTVLALMVYATPSQGATAAVGIQWDVNTDSPTGYRLCWANYSGNVKTFAFRNCSTVKHPANSKTITGLSTTEKWFFRVNAFNEFATSDWSNSVYLWFVRTPVNNKFQKLEIR